MLLVTTRGRRCRRFGLRRRGGGGGWRGRGAGLWRGRGFLGGGGRGGWWGGGIGGFLGLGGDNISINWGNKRGRGRGKWLTFAELDFAVFVWGFLVRVCGGGEG